MFNKTVSGTDSKEFETIIGPSVKVKGDFHGVGNITVEGTVEGSLKTNGNLNIGQKAKVTADVEAKAAKIGGEIRGNVKIKEYLEITSTAKVVGDIEAASLSVERGAILNGKCAMTAATDDKKIIRPKAEN